MAPAMIASGEHVSHETGKKDIKPIDIYWRDSGKVRIKPANFKPVQNYNVWT